MFFSNLSLSEVSLESMSKTFIEAPTMADMLLDEGIYVIGFFFPVVPKDKARIRVQLSAAHEIEHLDKAIEAFVKVGNKLQILKS